jgi:hypothetical protein
MILQRQKIFLAIALILLSAAVGVVLFQLKPLFWSRIWSARVELNGSPLIRARVYHGSRDYIMVHLGPPSENDYRNIYVVRIPREQIGVTGDSYFWFVSPLGALAKDTPDPSINMMHDKNNFTDPHLMLVERSATFKTMQGQTIHVKW